MTMNQALNFADIPAAHEDSSRCRIIFEHISDDLDLIDFSSIFGFPACPLFTIDRTEVSPFFGKFFIFHDLTDEFDHMSIPLVGISWILLQKIVLFQVDLIAPFVPDFYPILSKVSDIRISFEKPEKLVDDALNENFLSRKKWKALIEIYSILIAENASRTNTGSLFTISAIFHDVFQEVEILFHKKD